MEQLWESQKKHDLFDTIFPEMFSPTFFSMPELATTIQSTPKKTCLGTFNLLAPKQLEKNKIYRWLVDTDGKLWFANEGSPSMVTPAHFQMTGQVRGKASCLAAGNITFSEQGSVLLLTNKSGDFMPKPSSLIHFFAAIYFGSLESRLGLDNVIKLELWRVGKKETGCVTGIVTWSDVQAWFENMSAETKDTLGAKYTPQSEGCIRNYSLAASSRKPVHGALFKAPSPYTRSNITNPTSIGNKTEVSDSLSVSF